MISWNKIGATVAVALLAFGIYKVGYAIGGAQKEAELAKEQASAVLKKFNENAERIFEAATKTQTEIVYKEKYFHTKEKEIEKVIVPLESCPLPDDAIRLWNEAATCALGDSEAECGTGN